MLYNSIGELVANEELVFPLISVILTVGIKCLGTGFFINEHGGFITAKHVFKEPNGDFLPTLYGVQSLSNGNRILRTISYIDCHPDADIALGMLGSRIDAEGNRLSEQPPMASTLAISLNGIMINDAIKTYGYPIQEISEDDGQQIISFQGIASEGKILEYCPEGSLRTRNPCYKTSMKIQHGQSGGPVIKDYYVIGVNSSSEQGDTPSYITPLSFIQDLKVKEQDKIIPFSEIIRRHQII